MNRGPLLFFLSLLVLAGTALGYFGLQRLRDRGQDGPVKILGTHVEQVSDPAATPGWLKEFTLTERSGKDVNSEDLHGKVQVACFFFARCQASCRKQTETLRDVEEDYLGKDVVFLSITCDPSFDTPEALRKYASEFEADEKQWLFLTGDLQYIRRVGGEAFLVPVDERAHVDRFVVRDKWGNVREAFDWKDPAEIVRMKGLIDELIVETEPPAEFQKQEEPVGAEATTENETEEEVSTATAGERGT